MVYNIPHPYLFIFWFFSITSSVSFVLGGWKSIIINFITIFQERFYTLSICCVYRSLTCIGLNLHLPPIPLIFNIFKQVCLTNFSVQSNPPLNTAQLTLFEKSSCFMKIKSCSLLATLLSSLPVITILLRAPHLFVLVKTFINQLGQEEVVREDQTGRTNT